jgi:hypothetical protein
LSNARKNYTDQVLERVLRGLIDCARDLAYFDEQRKVSGADGTFRKMQSVSHKLSKLRQAVERYDEALDYFKKEKEYNA